ncbi:unnamed protein product [Vitrella brassicaformis CCMP3155]|uniref:Uncharacterized protein n=1 Tax=Vitrella brassicaformis (strain CCMP3155) TaxID=1169540 RepID=A0A0G4FNR6_VITBC|nr:unnamed protein product [Vitrella brassicaformis CCMP3155]|eukprot:CEM15827.1 unnamed protein product [Vitrella brassicaformis CCMP3155]
MRAFQLAPLPSPPLLFPPRGAHRRPRIKERKSPLSHRACRSGSRREGRWLTHHQHTSLTHGLRPVPSLWALSLKKASHMLDDRTKRPALNTQINKQPPTQIPKGITLPAVLEQRIEQAMDRERLRDVLAFDIGDVAGAIKILHVLERCSGHWKVMKWVIRLALIYQLTPNATRPLMLSAGSLPATTVFDELPLIMAAYKTFGHYLSYRGRNLALQQANNGHYRIGAQSFRVVPLGELPADHPYRSRYKESDPVIRHGLDLSPSLSSFLLHTLLESRPWAPVRVLLSLIILRDSQDRYQRLMAAGDVPEQQGIAVDYRFDVGGRNYTDPKDYRRVFVSGFRPGETVAAHLFVGEHRIELWTTEPPVAGPAPSLNKVLDVRFPVSTPLWRSVLKRFNLEGVVINWGIVLV